MTHKERKNYGEMLNITFGRNLLPKKSDHR